MKSKKTTYGKSSRSLLASFLGYVEDIKTFPVKFPGKNSQGNAMEKRSDWSQLSLWMVFPYYLFFLFLITPGHIYRINDRPVFTLKGGPVLAFGVLVNLLFLFLRFRDKSGFVQCFAGNETAQSLNRLNRLLRTPTILSIVVRLDGLTEVFSRASGITRNCFPPDCPKPWSTVISHAIILLI